MDKLGGPTVAFLMLGSPLILLALAPALPFALAAGAYSIAHPSPRAGAAPTAPAVPP